jgi:prevent-host-death family protein
MKTLQSAEAKTHFSSVLKDIEAGNEVAIVNGRKKETVAVIIPYEKWKKNQKRRLGTLEGKMSVKFAEDFSMTDEELINCGTRLSLKKKTSLSTRLLN